MGEAMTGEARVPGQWRIGKYEQPICTIPVRSFAYEEEGKVASLNECGAYLHAEWTFTVPIGPHFVLHSEDVPGDALTSSWQLACENGHVHRVSASAHTAEEYADALDWDAEFPPAPPADPEGAAP